MPRVQPPPEVGTGLHTRHPQPAVLPFDDQVTDPGVNENWASQYPTRNFPASWSRGSPETTSTQKPSCWSSKVGLRKGAQRLPPGLWSTPAEWTDAWPPLTGFSFLDLVWRSWVPNQWGQARLI